MHQRKAAYSSHIRVTINLAPVNDAPVAGQDGPYGGTEDTTFNIALSTLIANDTDVDEAVQTAWVQAVGGTGGTASVVGNNLQFVPTPNSSGVATFTYRLYDGGVYSNDITATLNLAAVNDAPVAGQDGPYGATEDTSFNVALSTLIANDSDADGGPETSWVQLVSSSISASKTGSAIQLSPPADFSGVATFTYRLYDGAAYSNAITATVNFAAIDDPPFNDANQQNYVLADGATMSIANLAFNDIESGRDLTVYFDVGPTEYAYNLSTGQHYYGEAHGYTDYDWAIDQSSISNGFLQVYNYSSSSMTFTTWNAYASDGVNSSPVSSHSFYIVPM